MAVFIIGHGVQESGDPSAGIPDSTVVPARGELTFFSASGSTLRMANGVAALEANSRENGYRYEAGAPIENYRLTPLADDERQLFETVQANTDTLAAAIYVGDRLPDGIRLCESMACEGGVHRCRGVLGLFPGPIIVLACRGTDEGGTDQANFGTSESGAIWDKYGERYTELQQLTPLIAGERLFQLASTRTAEAQAEAAYMLTNSQLAKALDTYNSFAALYLSVRDGNSSFVWDYIAMYDALDPVDQYHVETEWDVDNRVNATVESTRQPHSDEDDVAAFFAQPDPSSGAPSTDVDAPDGAQDSWSADGSDTS